MSVLGVRDLQPDTPVPLVFADGNVNRFAAIEAASKAGADTVLTGRPRFMDSSGAPYGSATVRIGDPEVAAFCRYQLIDVRTGEVISPDYS
jgi:hypothetical protein